MDDKKYEKLLYGDISSVVTYRRAGIIPKLLKRPDLHHRLIYGSDYPVPAISIVVRYRTFKKLNLLT